MPERFQVKTDWSSANKLLIKPTKLKKNDHNGRATYWNNKNAFAIDARTLSKWNCSDADMYCL